MKAPSTQTRIRGNLGGIFRRGRSDDALEKQLYSHVNLPIIFNRMVKIDEIKSDFDFVIVATGDYSITKEFGLWGTTLNAYAYLIPKDSQEAYLILIVNHIKPDEMDYYWKLFITTEKLSYNIIETKDIVHIVGFVEPVQVGNIYFIGNAAGFMDALLGFGTFNAIESGILAARSIVKNLDYTKLIAPIVKDMKALHQHRKVISKFTNADFDRFIALMDLPGIKQFVYNNPFFKLRYTGSIAKFTYLFKK